MSYLNVSMLFSGTVLLMMPSSMKGLNPDFFTTNLGVGDGYRTVGKYASDSWLSICNHT